MAELKRSNKELEQFAYVSSHDLKEPLRMVILFSQLLQKRYQNRLDDDADEFIEYIVEGAQRMNQLITDLLTYSRVTTHAKEFQRVDLERVLDDVLASLSVSLKESKATITHDPLPTIFSEPSQMGQVFQNLIANAIKFKGPKTPEIHISAVKGENKWIFKVSDNGIGIDPEHQEQIFDVFRRLHTRKKFPGTGIGLSICQKIIKNHGGKIWVESEPGQGSSFYFTIPDK
jgi:light-regulated signal transduction histidine kinase (bacteriophytochrome)